MKLLAPAPGWTASADVIVVGSGIAGLTTALQCRTYGLSVLLVTKARVDEGSTKWAQGGIAAALGDGDSPEAHEKDTLVAGAGLCDVDAVRVLVTEGPEAVRTLIERGAIFDKEASGEIALTREGGHLRNRILHAGEMQQVRKFRAHFLLQYMKILTLKLLNMHLYSMRSRMTLAKFVE
jgi:L-aspartate oxidase